MPRDGLLGCKLGTNRGVCNWCQFFLLQCSLPLPHGRHPCQVSWKWPPHQLPLVYWQNLRPGSELMTEWKTRGLIQNNESSGVYWTLGLKGVFFFLNFRLYSSFHKSLNKFTCKRMQVSRVAIVMPYGLMEEGLLKEYEETYLKFLASTGRLMETWLRDSTLKRTREQVCGPLLLNSFSLRKKLLNMSMKNSALTSKLNRNKVDFHVLYKFQFWTF